MLYQTKEVPRKLAEIFRKKVLDFHEAQPIVWWLIREVAREIWLAS
jgi:hypothetical protein